MEHYVSIFFEGLWNASIIPFGQEPSFYAMLYFGGYNMWVASVIAIVAATAGQMFNWKVGKTFFKFHTGKNFNVSEYWYNRISYLFNRYGIVLLLFSWAPLCKLFVLVSGFLNVRPKFVFQLVLIGQIFNYAHHLFY